jgi:F-type H+-transporting ATPase subunit alpha
VRTAATEIPNEVTARLATAEQLSDEDRATIIQIARNALAGFQPGPESPSEPDARKA